ncbi:hypothetical protein MLD38_008707 [Melastoma candidum]|uniref:Uncharacterized protein n=1 Tax=Melastoma candidum TaxID=119954 RepID=A0ACB9S3R3_9MYRT|nr:hypothetical protein MLD38_008707 [Melastoma candidum]
MKQDTAIRKWSGHINHVPPFLEHRVNPSQESRFSNDAGDVTFHDDPAHILAYYSLVGPRTDCPKSVIPLHLLSLLPA